MFDAGRKMQGRKVIAAPKTRQSLLSGKHAMPVRRKDRRAGLQGRKVIVAPQTADPVVRGA